MDQRRQANWYLDWSKWIVLLSRPDRFTRSDVFHSCHPRRIRRRPRRVENQRLGFAQTLRQRELRIADADLIRLDQRSILKQVHTKRGNVNNHSSVSRHRVWSRQHFGAFVRGGVRLIALGPIIVGKRSYFFCFLFTHNRAQLFGRAAASIAAIVVSFLRVTFSEPCDLCGRRALERIDLFIGEF